MGKWCEQVTRGGKERREREEKKKRHGYEDSKGGKDKKRKEKGKKRGRKAIRKREEVKRG